MILSRGFEKFFKKMPAGTENPCRLIDNIIQLYVIRLYYLSRFFASTITETESSSNFLKDSHIFEKYLAIGSIKIPLRYPASGIYWDAKCAAKASAP